MFVENTAPFFADFGVDITIDGVAARGIFDNPSIAAGGGIGMGSTRPIFTLPTSSVPADPVGRALVHAGVTYAIAISEPDGTGMSVLELERTA